MKTLLKSAVLAAALITSASAAQAQMQQIASAGYWAALAGRNNDGNLMCSMSLRGDRERSMLIKWQSSDDEMIFIQIDKDNWRIPRDTDVPVTFQFDGGNPFDGVAVGKVEMQSMIETNIRDYNTKRRFLREFIDANRMRVSFPAGAEREWVLPMDGSDKIARTFMQCITYYSNKSKPTQPFGGGTVTQPYQGGGATQPFDSNKSPAKRKLDGSI